MWQPGGNQLFERCVPLVDGLCNCPARSHGSGTNKTTAATALDEFGDQLASCMRTGRVQGRANLVEKVWMQVIEEAGGTLVPSEKIGAQARWMERKHPGQAFELKLHIEFQAQISRWNCIIIELDVPLELSIMNTF